MTISEFIGKFKSKMLWGNLLAMVCVIVLLLVGIKYALALYTHHGESIPIPNLVHKSLASAVATTDALNLDLQVTDTGYVKSLPPDCVLEQTPGAGNIVKPGRTIYVTVNASRTPTLQLPDIIDNSSLREAMAKLQGLGFKLTQPQFIPGEKDWVYGVLVNGRHVLAGDAISVEDSLTIQVGNGQRGANDSIHYIDHATFDYEDYREDLERLKQRPSTDLQTPTEPSDGDEPEESAPEATIEPLDKKPAAPVTPAPTTPNE